MPPQNDTTTIDLLTGAPATAPAFSEFTPAPAQAQPPVRTIVLPPDPAMMGQKYLKLHTQNKIRQAFHHLAMNNIDAVQSWLHDVAKDSPAKAVELYLELAKFSLPQLRETSVNVTQNNQTRTFQSSADILAELEKPE